MGRIQVSVCTGDPSIAFSAQAEAFESITDYEASGVGPVLVILCALMWLITGEHECKHACLDGHANARMHARTQSSMKWQVSSGSLLLCLRCVVLQPES